MVVTSAKTRRPQGAAIPPRQILLANELPAVTLEDQALRQDPAAGVQGRPDVPSLAAKVFHQPPDDKGAFGTIFGVGSVSRAAIDSP